MSIPPGSRGRNPFALADRTPGPLGQNDAAAPHRPGWHLGDTPGSLGVKDGAARIATGGAVLLAQAFGPLPVAKRRPSDPVLIAPEEVEELLAPGNTKLDIGGIWGEVRRGTIWHASDGDRFVLSATSTDVIYYRHGSFYFQNAAGFIGEIVTTPFHEAGVRALPFVKVVEVEMRLILGIVAGASGVGFALVVGTEIGEFLLVHGKDFGRWNEQVEAVLRARAILKSKAPTLYDKLFGAVLHQAWKDMKHEIPEAITPEVVAFMVGVIMGHLGKHATKGPLSALLVIWTVVEALAMRFLVSVVPGAVQLTAREYEQMAREIADKIKNSGITLVPEDVRRMIDEVRQHPEEVRSAYRTLEKVFREFQAER